MEVRNKKESRALDKDQKSSKGVNKNAESEPGSEHGNRQRTGH